jgi:hypothetical protein
MMAAASNPGPGRTHKTVSTSTMHKDILIPCNSPARPSSRKDIRRELEQKA